MYFSVNCDPKAHYLAFLNFVFPARSIRSEGHCPILKAKFELTKPESWQLLESCYVTGANSTPNAPASIALADRKVEYYRTPFGTVEAKLNALDFAHLP